MFPSLATLLCLEFLRLSGALCRECVEAVVEYKAVVEGVFSAETYGMEDSSFSQNPSSS